MTKITMYFLLAIPFTLHAQHKLKGTLKDQAGKPLDAATITITKDDKSIAYALADSGRFILDYKSEGTHMLKVTLIGFKPLIRVVNLPKDTVSLTMIADRRDLGEVVISSAKPVIERHIDRVTFNVENSIVASGGSAWDAISKAPGVQAKPDNSLTANRKDVQIYIDGKPLRMAGDEQASYLQGLPSDLIAKIEVFANPPAMFEAQGASVINVITKKSKKEGFNGTLTGGLTQATHVSGTSALSLNYRKDKINIFGSYGYSDRHFQRDQNDFVTYTNVANKSFWDSKGINNITSSSHNYRVGIDYQINKDKVLGFLFTGNNRTGNILTNTQTTVTGNGNVLPDSTLMTTGISDSKGNQFAFNINYKVKLDTGGKSLNFDLDYSPLRYDRGQKVANITFLPGGILSPSIYRISTPTTQNINIYSGTVDYNSKLGKLWTLSSGLKYSSVKSQNNFDYFNSAGPQPDLIIENSNHFRYIENTGAAYTSVSGTAGKWTFQAGLRGEYTRTNGFSLTLDSLNKRNYFKVFPTFYSVYKLNDNHEFQVTYSYRIDRPNFALLNPGKHYATQYNYLAGNPALQPAFVHSIELGYTYKQDYNVVLYYQLTNSLFSNVTVQDNFNKLFYDTFQNLGLSANAGIRLSAPFHPAKWWEMNISVEGFYDREKSAYLQGSYDFHKFSYDGNTTQSFTLDNKLGLKAEISAYYYAPGIQGIFKQGHNASVDAGIKASVLKGKGTLKIAAGDIFFTNTYRIKVDYLGQNNGFYQRNDTRNATVSFSYRFGKNISPSRDRTTSSDQEKQRAQ